MNILFVGEIVGSPGREVVKTLLQSLKKEYTIDWCFCNAENITHGVGTTREKVEELRNLGIDFCTSGNHVFKFENFIPELDDPDLPILRPANYPKGVFGRGYELIDGGKKGKVLLINLLGRSFMRETVDCPFGVVDQILKKFHRMRRAATVVDLHAETTSEKRAMGFYLDGRVTLVVGSHTHVPTADARLLPKKTGYVTDIGMVGTYNSVLGEKKESVIAHLKTQLPHRFELEEEGQRAFNGVLVSSGKDGLARSIKRIDIVL